MCSIMFKFHKSKYISLSHTLRIIYISLYQSIIQYGMIIWGGASKNVLLQKSYKNSIICICFEKDNLI